MKIFLVNHDTTHLRGEYVANAVVVAPNGILAKQALLHCVRKLNREDDDPDTNVIDIYSKRLSFVELGDWNPQGDVEPFRKQGKCLILTFTTGKDFE